jgi:hypothetical protein
MIINSAPQNEAVVSNVGEIGEFRIRNSAKAFSILSSGLYANKIRAIIRELSCNAVDSHAAAGKQSTPFDVHLPNALEPHFSIRDYGTGLTHDQVTNIYTTYFESTKTNSNEFIGALGLGSKSPFSYTDNFTVTAIKDGRKGIYTAFINEQGVPSIALMMEEQSDEPAGVEVKFSVNDRNDFNKFVHEAKSVYKWFKLQPVVSGVTSFEVSKPVYETENIIPGVSVMKEGKCVAIMGNIAYPIEIPQGQIENRELNSLLYYCSLAMEFDIGELDFQASREGLSYIPQTIDAIKRKLEAVNGILASYIAAEANKITNTWERSWFLASKKQTHLWQGAVSKYCDDTKFPMWDNRSYYGHQFKLKTEELQKKYNIILRGFHRSSGANTFSNMNSSYDYDYDNKDQNGQPIRYQTWTVGSNKDVVFVINDTKVGATERSKFHYRTEKGGQTVYVIEPFDRTKAVDTKKFFKDIYNPPKNMIVNASELREKPRKDSSVGKNVTILQLESRTRGGWRDWTTWVWADAGKADTFDKKDTHYYLPLSGFQSLGKYGDVKQLRKHLEESGVFRGTVYGVRKGDMEFISTQKNWVNIDTMIAEKLAKLDQANIMGMVKQAIDFGDGFKYNVATLVDAKSPYSVLVNTFHKVEKVEPKKQQSLEALCRAYDIKTSVSPSALIDKYKQEVQAIKGRYPLLNSLYSSVESHALAEYINLIDAKKGV